MRILLSTLRYIHTIAESNVALNQLLTPILLPFADEIEEKLIKFTDQNKNTILTYLSSILIYPNCETCNQPICGSSKVCSCIKYNVFRSEKIYLENEIKKTEKAIQLLDNAAFRPHRNSFAFGATIFGGINGIATAIGIGINISLLVSATICAAATLPALFVFAFVYKRGANEEKKIINDFRTDYLDQAIRLRHNHIQLVKQRQDKKNIANIFLNQPKRLLKPKKEKRGIFGNPLSHFIGSALAIFAIASVLILKVGVLIGLVSNPIGWTVAAVIAITVGCYFAYNRYQFLTNKITCDRQTEILKQQHTMLERSLETTKLKLKYKLKYDKQPAKSPLLNNTPKTYAKTLPQKNIADNRANLYPLKLFSDIKNNVLFKKNIINHTRRYSL